MSFLFDIYQDDYHGKTWVMTGVFIYLYSDKDKCDVLTGNQNIDYFEGFLTFENKLLNQYYDKK